MLAMSWLLLYGEGFRIRRELYITDTTQLLKLMYLVKSIAKAGDVQIDRT
jgi:hypothetical protein